MARHRRGEWVEPERTSRGYQGGRADVSEALTIPGSFRLTSTSVETSSDPSFLEYQQMLATLQAMEGAVQLWIGDTLNIGESAYGEKYAQAVDPVQATTWKQYAWVARSIEKCTRVDFLGFGFYRQIAGFGQADQERWITWCCTPVENTLPTYRDLQRALRAERQTKQLSQQLWPEGQYGVIYCDPPWRPDEGLLDPSREIENQADPPWRYGNAGVVTDSDNYGRAERHYPTMTIDEISTYRRRQRGPKNRRRSSAFARSSSVISPFVGDTLSRLDGVSPSSVR